MNPLVSEMLSTRAGQDVELRFLEDLLNDDCKCEGNEHGGQDCTKEVTHMVSTCRYEQKACRVRAAYFRAYVSLREGYFCSKCSRPGSHCWEIRPI